MSISSVSVMSLNMLHVSMLKWNRTTSSPLDYPSGVLLDLIWGYKAKPDSFFPPFLHHHVNMLHLSHVHILISLSTSYSPRKGC